MTTLISNGNRRCDARCYNGKPTTKCQCICSGMNHSAGHDKAVENNRRLFLADDEGSKLFPDCPYPPGVNRSKYEIVQNVPGATLIIRDVGHENHRSVTNDAERVVEDLVREGLLTPGRRLFYYDSQGQLDELLVRDGRFAGFAPGPRAERSAG